MSETSTLNPPAPITATALLDRLPDSFATHLVTHKGCPRRTRMQLDLLLLAIEALNLKGSHDILYLARQLELETIIPNRVTLWCIRNTNPLRRLSRRRAMSLIEAKALTLITCQLARRLNLVIRKLLNDAQQLQERNQSLDKNPHLANYLERFRAHFRSRMNPRRSAVLIYDTDDKLNDLALNLLAKLLFCTGTAGIERLWVSLFNGEVV